MFDGTLIREFLFSLLCSMSAVLLSICKLIKRLFLIKTSYGLMLRRFFKLNDMPENIFERV